MDPCQKTGHEKARGVRGLFRNCRRLASRPHLARGREVEDQVPIPRANPVEQKLDTIETKKVTEFPAISQLQLRVGFFS